MTAISAKCGSCGARYELIFICSALIVVSLSRDSVGQENQETQLLDQWRTLEGHTGVWVGVALSTGETFEPLSISRKSIESFVISRLKNHGITTAKNVRKASLFLEINVDVFDRSPASVHFLAWRIRVLQLSRLLVNDRISLASTWQVAGFGAISKQNVSDFRTAMERDVDSFVSDFKKANEPAVDPFSDPQRPE